MAMLGGVRTMLVQEDLGYTDTVVLALAMPSATATFGPLPIIFSASYIPAISYNATNTPSISKTVG